MLYLAAVLVAIGIAIDILSFGLGVRRLRGDGPSGVPLVALLFYVFAAGLWAQVHDIALVLCALVGAVAFHLLSQWLGLLVLDWYLPKKQL